MMQHRVPCKEDGFSVVEVIVAFTIVVFAIVGLYRAIEHSYQLAAEGQLREDVAAFARSELEAIGADGHLVTNVIGGTLVKGIIWRITVQPITSATQPATAKEIRAFTVVFEAFRSNGTPVVTLRTVKLGLVP